MPEGLSPEDQQKGKEFFANQKDLYQLQKNVEKDMYDDLTSDSEFDALADKRDRVADSRDNVLQEAKQHYEAHQGEYIETAKTEAEADGVDVNLSDNPEAPQQ